MSFQIGEKVLGRPQFAVTNTPKLSQTHSLLENRSIKHLRPNANNPYSIWGRIQALFWRIISLLVSLKKPSAITFKALVATGKSSQSEMLNLFKECIPSNRKQTALLQQYEDLLQEVRGLKHYTNDERRLKEKLNFQESFVKKIKNLSNGQSLLLPLTGREDINIFYLLTKNSKGYSLKIIGCDQWMSQLSDVPSKKIGGKEKVLSQIAFQNIPEALLTGPKIFALFCEPLFENYFNANDIHAMLSVIPAECKVNLTDQENLWVTQTKSPRKAISLLMQEINPTKNNDSQLAKVERKRLEFQTRLHAFFDFYKQSRFYLEQESSYISALQYMSREIAKETSLLEKKGYLTKNELIEIHHEINEIEKTIKTAEKRAFVPLSNLGKIKQSDVTLTIDTKIQAPIEIIPISKSFEPRAPKELNPPLAAASTTLLTEEERKTMRSTDALSILKIIQEKKAQATQWVQQGQKELAISLVIELTNNISFAGLFYNEVRKPSWLESLSLQQVFDLQNDLIELSKIIVNNRKKNIPLPNQAVVMLQLMRLTHWLDVSIQQVNTPWAYDHSGIWFDDIFNRNVSCPGLTEIPHDLQRPFYMVDGENIPGITSLIREKVWHAKYPFKVTKEDEKRSLDLVKQQNQQLFKFYEINSPEELEEVRYAKFSSKAFQPQQIQTWSKQFQNPFFVATLRQMELHRNRKNFGSRFCEPHHGVGRGMLTGHYNPKIDGRIVSDEELDEMLKNLNRYESLKLPESISDNPLRVFKVQHNDLLERMKEYGAEGSYTPKAVQNEFKKEELSDLLCLLRKDSPQLEAIAFIQTHPHLLSNPDVRNFVEIAMFDIGGSSLEKTLQSNPQFTEALPGILQEQFDRYQKLAKENPRYNTHLLFIHSLMRKFKDVYQAYGQDKILIDQFELQSESIDAILKNQFLREYHFRAVVESLFIDIDKPSDVNKTIMNYFLMQSLPKEAHDFDPNEMDKLQRRYAVLLQSLKNASIDSLHPLLDHLCHNKGLKLDDSEWEGDFPKFKNGQYEVNLLQGTIFDLSTGISSGSLPTDITTHPSYAALGVDAASMNVWTTQRANITVYIISDKNGKRGNIEVENGTYRFYKLFPGIEKPFQIISYTDPRMPLRTCKYYFSPDNLNEGLELNEQGKILSKTKLLRKGNQFHIESMVDCRYRKELGPYQVETLERAPHPSLKRLEQFESGKEILLLTKNNNLERILFPRYHLSFSFKRGKLYCENKALHGYWIDMQGSFNDLNHGLILRHKDSGMPQKLLLSDPSVIVSKIETKTRQPSFFEKQWLSLKTRWTGKTDPEYLQEKFSVEGPQHTKHSKLNANLFTIRPYTNELIIADESKKIQNFLALIAHSKLNAQFDLAHNAFKLLKLAISDLSHENVQTLLKFLNVEKNDEGNISSIKIQLALKLKRIIGKKLQFHLINERLNALIEKHCRIYLRHGRRTNQNLQLSPQQFERVAKIIKKCNPEFYEQHLRIFFLEKGKAVPPFNPNTGVPVWDGYDEIDLKAKISSGKSSGLHGANEIPLEILEKELLFSESESKEAISLESVGQSILFSEKELEAYFDSTSSTLPDVNFPNIDDEVPSCEKQAVSKLKNEMEQFKKQSENRKLYSFKANQTETLINTIQKSKVEFRRVAKMHRNKIDLLLSGKDDITQSLAIRGGLQKIASFQEISVAFMQKELQTLMEKGLLPSNITINELESTLRDYFEAETKLLLLENALKMRKDPIALYKILSTKRFYSPDKHPELLVYECFTQQIFRQLGFDKNQIHLMSDILANKNGVFQAITGGGKTTVLSVLRGLLQANGQNLVTFRLLPTLFEQSKSILQQKLGITFDRKIYSLQFNLKMSPVIREKQKGGKIVENSLFKKIYHDLLVTMKEKGCVLTDYKSIPLLQEKWIKFNREFLARQRNNMPIPEIEMQHWIYLKKILRLIKAGEETLMDEFDVPNRSCNRLQIPLGNPISLAPFLYETAMNIYEDLRNDPDLKLTLDQQRDVSDEVRTSAIRKIAAKFAKDDPDLIDYFLGKKEIDHSKYSKNLDLLALIKDQCSIFLPLTLRKASGLDYQRSADGTKTVPCHEGEPQENSRFGHPLEEINYTIQDYIQNGVSLPELKSWIKDLIDESINSDLPSKEFAALFPDCEFPQNMPNDKLLKEWQKQINANWQHVKQFLQIKLKEVKTSGEVISMTPHDSAAMTKAVSGLSATLGCPEELPQEFEMDPTKVNGIIGEMAYRLIERTKNQKELLEYDPEKPFDVLSQGNFEALIDGAGTYRSFPARTVATQLKKAQTKLKQVGYHNGKPDFVGEMECRLNEKGFYFTKAKSRGADIPLHPTACALLTVDGLKNLEDLLQNDGRMREKNQEIRIARSKLNQETDSMEELLVRCARNAGQSDSVGLFRSKMQQISHFVRQKAYLELLNVDNFKDTLTQFEQWETLFIQKPLHDYNQAGSYYAQNKQIRKVEYTPGNVLEQEKARWIKKAKELNLNVDDLEKLTWDRSVLEKMPAKVPGVDDPVSTGLEVEQEIEVEHSVEREMDVEQEAEVEEELNIDQCGDVPFYPPWVGKNPKEFSAAQWLHPTIDPRIVFIENFLPLERKDNLFKRTPFDSAMQKIRTVHVVFDASDKIEKVILGDVLDDVLHRPYEKYGQYDEAPLTKSELSYTYDLRTRKCIAGSKTVKHDRKDFHKIVAQVKFINGEFEGYSEEEWKALLDWLGGLDNPKQMMEFFEKTVLRTKPRKAAKFKQSKLYQEFIQS